MTDREDIAHTMGVDASENARCPQCGSTDISPGERDDGKTWPLPVEYICNDCGKEWMP